MSEIALKRDNDRLRREIAELRQRIAELEARLPKHPEASKVTPEKRPLDVFNPCPNDHAFNALRAQHQQKRRSWLNIT
jgi:hypothetical protein